jgi:hypothetical protein
MIPALETLIHVVPDVLAYEPAFDATDVNVKAVPAPTLPSAADVVQIGRVATMSENERSENTSLVLGLVARIENVMVPSVLGVPLSTPVAEAKDTPAGKDDPATIAYKPVFVALSVRDVIASSLAASTSVDAVAHPGRNATTSVKARSAYTSALLVLVARIVNDQVLAVYGFPLNTPVDALITIPSGRDPPTRANDPPFDAESAIDLSSFLAIPVS